jgi:hypothetical protein
VARQPTPRSAPEPATPAPTPTPTPEPAKGELRIVVLPWARVEVDGQVVGTTPLEPQQLSVGAHKIRLLNPGFRPLMRTVTIEPGRASTLRVNLNQDAFPLTTQ